MASIQSDFPQAPSGVKLLVNITRKNVIIIKQMGKFAANKGRLSCHLRPMPGLTQLTPVTPKRSS